MYIFQVWCLPACLASSLVSPTLCLPYLWSLLQQNVIMQKQLSELYRKITVSALFIWCNRIQYVNIGLWSVEVARTGLACSGLHYRRFHNINERVDFREMDTVFFNFRCLFGIIYEYLDSDDFLAKLLMSNCINMC